MSETTMDNEKDKTQTKQIINYLSEDEIDKCLIDSKWKCVICGKNLSRKQTLKTHLLAIHKIKAGLDAKRYKLYETDSSQSVPQSTKYLWKQKEENQSLMMNTAQVVDSPEKGTGNMCEESISECNVYVTSICDNNIYIDSGLLASENTIVTNTVIGTSDSDTYMESYPSALPLKDLQFGIVYDENIECAKNMDNLCEVDMDIDSEVSNSSDEPDNESNESLSDEDSTVIESPPLYILPPSDTLTTSPLTHMEHVMIVSGYATAYNLSGVAFQKLLDVINFHVPRNNLCEKKVSELKQKLGFGNDQDLEYFECCCRCGLLFKDQDNTCATPGCSGRRYKGEDETKKFALSHVM